MRKENVFCRSCRGWLCNGKCPLISVCGGGVRRPDACQPACSLSLKRLSWKNDPQVNFCCFPFPVGWTPRSLFQGIAGFLGSESKSTGSWLGCSEQSPALPGCVGCRLTPTGLNHSTEGSRLPGSGSSRAVVEACALCWRLSLVPVIPPAAVSVC